MHEAIVFGSWGLRDEGAATDDRPVTCCEFDLGAMALSGSSPTVALHSVLQGNLEATEAFLGMIGEALSSAERPQS